MSVIVVTAFNFSGRVTFTRVATILRVCSIRAARATGCANTPTRPFSSIAPPSAITTAPAATRVGTFPCHLRDRGTGTSCVSMNTTLPLLWVASISAVQIIFLLPAPLNAGREPDFHFVCQIKQSDCLEPISKSFEEDDEAGELYE